MKKNAVFTVVEGRGTTGAGKGRTAQADHAGTADAFDANAKPRNAAMASVTRQATWRGSGRLPRGLHKSAHYDGTVVLRVCPAQTSGHGGLQAA